MTTLIHDNKEIATVRDDWQTRDAGLNDKYQIYLCCADDGKGNDVFTGEPLKTFDQWLNS